MVREKTKRPPIRGKEKRWGNYIEEVDRKGQGKGGNEKGWETERKYFTE